MTQQTSLILHILITLRNERTFLSDKRQSLIEETNQPKEQLQQPATTTFRLIQISANALS